MASRALFLTIVLAACGGSSSSVDGSGGGDDGGPLVDADPSCPAADGTFTVKAQPVVTGGLTQPLFVAQAPGNNTDLFVVEKPGRIRIVRNGAVLPTPFLDVTSLVNIPEQNAEGGLLGLAFNADYQTSKRFFVYLSLKSPSRVAVLEFHRSAGSADVADATPVAELISESHGASGSLGGTIAFGPDGYLWVAIGDNGNGPNGQDLSTRLGKMLRVDVDHPSTPPPGGLAGAAPNIWDYGFRNPYRFSFDRANGNLYIADAGDTMYEEVDIEAPGSGGHDYGWDRMEGRHCHNGAASCGSPGTLPQYELAHGSSFSVIVGGSVYRGAAIPAMRCRYLYAVYGLGRLLSFRYDGGADVTAFRELTDMFDSANIVMITSIAQDNAGELYLTTIDGNLYKIVPG